MGALEATGGILPLEVEIEFTNHCNAACSACPRASMPEYGFVSSDTIECVLSIWSEIRARNRTLFPHLASSPKITIAGGGEPFLHRQAISLIQRIRREAAQVHLITNGSAISEDRAAQLIEAGPASIACSFWGVSRHEYEAAMSLPYERTLQRVLHLGRLAKDAGIDFDIVWVRTPHIKSDDASIEKFWADRGLQISMDNSGMWNRAGLLGPSTGFVKSSSSVLPDPQKKFWCSEVSFSIAFDWKGNCILCCCGFFDRNQIILGSAHSDDWDTLHRRKQAILDSRPLPSPCRSCLLPRRPQAEWLVAPLLDSISPKERDTILYPPA